MKRQDYVFGSTTSNIEEQTPEALNNGWVELSILYSRVLNGVCAALSQSTNIVSQEVANAIVGMGVTLNPASDNQLLQVLQKLAIKATDFESPITASNKGATMKEIEEVVTSSFRFKGYVSTTQPTGNLVVDNLWINLSTMPSTFPVSASLIKKWNGSAWVNYGSAYTPMNFDAFRNNNDNEGYYWFGGQWKLLSTDLSTDYFRLNQTSGKWEIKSSVNLPGTPTCNTPSASNTRAIVNVDFVNNNTISSRNFTNCLTEIPQDKKLELNNGVLTLKAGAKVYVPNGAGVFNEITTQNDLTVSAASTGKTLICANSNGSGLIARVLVKSVSGTTRPLTEPYMLWYDITNNVINNYGSDSSTPEQTVSLPIAVVTVSNGAISSIDQVFNGFGYIGGTVFVLPGVKGLIPNGRNEDGTLKNSFLTVTSVKTNDYPGTNNNLWWGFAPNIYFQTGSLVKYDSINNTINWNVCIFAKSTVENGRITSFEPKTAFHAVDYDDFENTVEELDNSVVHKTGNETIDGNKTFKQNLSLSYNSLDLSTTQESGSWHTWCQVFDKNGVRASYIETSHQSNGAVQQQFGVQKTIDGVRYSAFLRVRVDSNKTQHYELGDSPESGSNGTDVATTAWVRDLFESLYPVGSIYVTSSNSTTCPLASIVKKSDNSNSTWALVSSGRALWTGTGSNGNTTIAAGLPNITGSFGRVASVNNVVSGAFTSGSRENHGSGGDDLSYYDYSIDASRSSSIYGQSSTVQPPAYVVNVWRRTA